MNRPMKKYVERFAALDMAAGIYQSRALKRGRYNQHDFLEYLSAYDLYDMMDDEPDFSFDFSEEAGE